MEDQVIALELLKPDTSSPEKQPIKVEGLYQIFEYQTVSAEKKLVVLPITVKVTQRPDLIALELYNDSESMKTYLNYPLYGVSPWYDASAWSEELQAFLYARAVGDTLVADIIVSPAHNQDHSRPATNRITWSLDENKCIREFYEYFDADGKLLDSSPGHFRTLVPMEFVSQFMKHNDLRETFGLEKIS